MIKLLEKDSVFDFNEECIKAFEMLKEKLTNAPIMVSPDWSQPFELMCDASDFTVGAVLGQCEGKHFRLGYNAVPPPYTGNFMPPKPDLSFSGLKEFVNEPIVKKPVVETSEAKASADEPKVVRKDNSAPIIEDWVSDSEEEDVPRAKIKKKSVKHSFAKIKFGKSKEQVKTPRKTTVKQGQSTARFAGERRYVAFGGNPKGGKITDREIVPKGGLTCLFAKATSDESKLWHRRLGHINFKTMNKLVKGNLVRGLPSKRFEIHQTCVACQKEKQHRASCLIQLIRLFYEEVYLFAYLEVEVEFQQDETSGILKSFITGVEKLIDQRVKVIKCDNGTEFKNKEMNQFCKRKGKARMETGDDEKKVTEEPKKEGGVPINVVGKTSIELPDDLNMPELEDIVYSDDDEDVGAEADMNNLDAFMPVSPIPTTRIHKDHPVEQIIGDLNSAPQTRRMTKNLEEHGLFSSVQQRTNHKDFQNCLFACFLSQEEPKKVIHALKDPSWIEAMQEELLQFKLQEFWTLVDLPNGKRAID
ncbi:putative ribonuclease H-like domain-containing protein [Tanacetum coccineum]